MWFAGTLPQGLFRSNDGGVNWAPFSGINDDAQYREWMGSEKDKTLNARVDEILRTRKPWKPAVDHPWHQPLNRTKNNRPDISTLP